MVSALTHAWRPFETLAGLGVVCYLVWTTALALGAYTGLRTAMRRSGRRYIATGIIIGLLFGSAFYQQFYFSHMITFTPPDVVKEATYLLPLPSCQSSVDLAPEGRDRGDVLPQDIRSLSGRADCLVGILGSTAIYFFLTCGILFAGALLIILPLGAAAADPQMVQLVDRLRRWFQERRAGAGSHPRRENDPTKQPED